MLHRSANDQYLQNTVLSASPARLRLMLLDRSVALVEAILDHRRRDAQTLTDERTLSLRDILGELLSGVTRDSNDLTVRIADLYVFLLQELTRAEQEPGLERIESIGKILRIEQETWRQVCEAAAKRNAPAPAPAIAPATGAHAAGKVRGVGAPHVGGAADAASLAGSLNLNA